MMSGVRTIFRGVHDGRVVVERWQVNQLQLPVLAELRLPPAPGKD